MISIISKKVLNTYRAESQGFTLDNVLKGRRRWQTLSAFTYRFKIASSDADTDKELRKLMNIMKEG
jgi:hypothetical protein